ncbi:hypothetical protein HK102_001814 [Quaeritorhiza haematococci]|nr:hypothetical protein HK102_001814 [Quaeritorhiza haematococci]
MLFSGAPELVGANGIIRNGNTFSLRLSDHFRIGQSGQLQVANTALGVGLVGGSDDRIQVGSVLPHVTAVGTITQGTWQGDVIGVTHGGTGLSTFPADRVVCTRSNGFAFHDTLVFDGSRMKIGSGDLDLGSVLTVHGDVAVGGHVRFGATSSLREHSRRLVVDAESVQVKSIYVDAAGNVGINTETPTNQLHVSGSMRASHAIVDGTLWLSQIHSNNDLEVRLPLGRNLSVVGGALQAKETAVPHILGGLQVTGNVLNADSLTVQIGSAQTQFQSDALVLQNQALELNPGPGSLRLGVVGPTYQLESTLLLSVETEIVFTKGFQIAEALTIKADSSRRVVISGEDHSVVVDNVPWSFALGSDTIAFQLGTKPQWISSPGVDVVCQGNFSLAGDLAFQTCNGLQRPLGALGWWYLGRLGIGTTVIRVDGYFEAKIVYDGVAAYTPYVTLQDRQTIQLQVYKQPLGAYQLFLYTLRTAVMVDIVSSPLPLSLDSFEGTGAFPDGTVSRHQPATDLLDFSTSTALGTARVTLGNLTVDDTATLKNAVVTNGLQINGGGATVTGPLVVEDPTGLRISGGANGDMASLSTGQLVLDHVDGSRVQFKQDFTVATVGLVDADLTVGVSGPLDTGIAMNVQSGPALYIDGDRSVTVYDALAVNGGLRVGRNVAAQTLQGQSLILSNSPNQLELQCDVSGNLTIGFKGIKQLSAPSELSDAATKGYVDSLIQGVTAKRAVKAIATDPIHLTSLPGAIDDILILEGDRVLLVAQANAVENGLYTSTAGTYVRSSDLPNGSRASGIYVFITLGTRYANSGFLCSTPGPADVVGTDPISFVQFNGAAQVVAGMGLQRVTNKLSVQVDDQSIEIAGNRLRLKGSGLGIGLSGGSGQPVWVSSITHLSALGTITAGRWQASVVGLQYGGTGSSSFLPGRIPFSNGTALTQGLLHFDAVNNRLGINTTVPVAGLNVHERDICLTRSSITPCHVLFTSAADNAMASVRFQESQLIWSLGPGNSKSDLIDQVRVTHQGELVARGAVKSPLFVADATVYGPERIWKTSPGSLTVDILTSDASGSAFRLFGTTGSVDDTANAEFLSVGYNAGQYAVKTGHSGAGMAKTLYLQSGNNVGQVILRPDGSVSLGDAASFSNVEVEVSKPLRVTDSADLRAITVDSVDSRGAITCSGPLTMQGVTLSVHQQTDLTVAARSTSFQGELVQFESDSEWLRLQNYSNRAVLNASQDLALSSNQSEILLGADVIVMAQCLDVRGSLKLPGVDLVANGTSVFSNGVRVSGPLTCTDVTVSGTLGANVIASRSFLFDNCEELRLGTGLKLELGRIGSLTQDLVLGAAGLDHWILRTNGGIQTYQDVMLAGSRVVVDSATEFKGTVQFDQLVQMQDFTFGPWTVTNQPETAITCNDPAQSLNLADTILINPDEVRVTKSLVVPECRCDIVTTTRIEVNGGIISGVATPGANMDAANKAYVDSVAKGLKLKGSVRAASAPGQNIDLIQPVTSVDSSPVGPADRVLLKNQTDPVENGFYVITATGFAVRSDDLPPGSNAAGVFAFIESGAVHGDTGFVCVSDPPTDVVGLYPLQFSQFNGNLISVRAGLSKDANNMISVRLDTLNSGLEFAGQALRISPSLAGSGLGFSSGKLQVLPITQVATVSAGLWRASPVELAYGGTGNTSFVPGGVVFHQNGQLTSDPGLFWDTAAKSLGINTTNPSPNQQLDGLCVRGQDVLIASSDTRGCGLYLANHLDRYTWALSPSVDHHHLILSALGGSTTKEGGLETLIVSDSNRVSIGRTLTQVSSQYTLDVNGPTNVEGELTLAQPLAVSSGGTGAAFLGHGLVVSNGPDAFSATGTFSAGSVPIGDETGQIILDSGISLRARLGLAIGADVQPWNANLTDVSGLSVAYGNFIVGNGSGFVTMSTATARTALGLGTLATANTIDNQDWDGEVLSVANGGTGNTGSFQDRGLLVYDQTLGKIVSSEILGQNKDLRLQGLVFDGGYEIRAADGTLTFRLSTDTLVALDANGMVVTGAVSVAGGISVANDLETGGDVHAQNVIAGTIVTSPAVSVTGTIDAALSVAGGLTAAKARIAQLTVNGPAEIEGTLLVASHAAFSEAVSVGSGMSVTNDLTVGNDLAVGDNLSVGTRLTVATDVAVGTSLAVGLISPLGGSLNVVSDADPNGISIKTGSTHTLEMGYSGDDQHEIKATTKLVLGAGGTGNVVLENGSTDIVGSLSTSENATFDKDVFVNGVLHVTGAVVQAGSTERVLTPTGLVNVVSVISSSAHSVPLPSPTLRWLSFSFGATPASPQSRTKFEWDLPELSTPFTSPSQVIGSASGYAFDEDGIPFALQNCFLYGVPGTTRVAVSFTSPSIGGVGGGVECIVQGFVQYTTVQ